MKFPVRFRVAPLLLTASVALVLPIVSSLVTTGIENPTCELFGPGVYRIDYQAAPDVGPVEVFASSRPDQIDSEKQLLTIHKTPADVNVTGRSGRVYFHLKPASGTTRVVSIRRLPLGGREKLSRPRRLPHLPWPLPTLGIGIQVESFGELDHKRLRLSQPLGDSPGL